MLQLDNPSKNATIAVMETTKGTIRIALYHEIAPKAVENFVVHAQEGYYDGMIFHRVINEFMLQSGDPTGTGMGGESIYKDENGNPTVFEAEFSEELWHFRGALSMANPGDPNYNQSQFFIVQAHTVPYTEDYLKQAGFPADVAKAYVENGGTPHLDGAHSIFGMVIEGMDVVDAIAVSPTDGGDKPLEDVVINKVTIENAG